MKALLLASALAFSGTAFAQDMTAPPPPPPPADAPMGPQTPPPPPPADAPPPAADMSAPPPPPAVGAPAPMNDGMAPAPAPKASYPWCSKTVTDGCKQRGG